MSKDYKNEDGVRIVPLGELHDFEVAEGYPDIRGWTVNASDGRAVGTVHELLVDADMMRTRYLDLRLASDIAATPGDRDVLVPIGAAQLDAKDSKVTLSLNAERVGLLPPYDHTRLTRAYEYEVRRHFTLGEAAAASSSAATRGFYDDDRYDDRGFFAAGSTDARPIREIVPDMREMRADGSGVRIPIAPGESVVLERGKDGHDEVIIRRPVDDDQRAR